MIPNLQPVFEAMLLSCAYCKHYVRKPASVCLSCELRENMHKMIDQLVEEKKLDAFELLPFED